LRATTKFEVVPPEPSPLDELRQRYPAVRSEAALVVDNGRVVTGGGVTLCIDAVLYLLEKRFGKQAVDEVARIMEYGAARAANSRRFASTAALS
jgi:transcriptional regulator GlxA family with amidase domain